MLAELDVHALHADGAACVDDEPGSPLLEILPARNECTHDANLQIYRKEDERKEYEMVIELVKLRTKRRVTAPLLAILIDIKSGFAYPHSAAGVAELCDRQ